MGYGLNRLDEPVFMAGPKPMLTEFGIHQDWRVVCPLSVLGACEITYYVNCNLI